MHWMAGTLIRMRFAIWIAVVAGSCLLWRINSSVQFDQSIEAFFPPDHPALLSYEHAKAAFGGDDIVFVAYDDERLWSESGMARVHDLAQQIRQQVSGVQRVDSLDQMPLPWKVDSAVETLVSLPRLRRALAVPGLVSALSNVESEVKKASERPASLDELKERVSKHPLFRNLLVDPTGRTTALVVQLKPADRSDQKATVIELRRIADGFVAANGIGHVAVVGPPVLLADGFISLERDNRLLGSVAMGLMALAMLVAARSPWWAVLPLASGVATWLVTEAFLNAADLRLTLSAGPIIAQTVVLCMPAASHLVMHQREAGRLLADPREAVRETLVNVAVPVAWCSLTAAAGYLALLSSSVRPVFQFGLTMAACNLLAGIFAYALAPGAMLPPRWRDWLGRGPSPSGRPVSETARNTQRVGVFTAWVLDHPGLMLGLFVVPSLLLATGISRLRFESNYIKIYRSDARVARDYRFVEDRMGGIGLVELVVPGPREAQDVSLEWLERLRGATDALRATHQDLIAEAVSLADVLLKEDNKDAPSAPGTEAPAESDATPSRAKRGTGLGGLLSRPAPSTATPDQLIQAKLTILGTPGFSHFIANFWVRSAGQTRVIIRIRESADAETKQAAFDRMLAEARERFGPESDLTGLSHLMTQVTRAIITTQFQSTAWSCAVILGMLVLSLRSVRLAVLALLPTLLSVALALGAMGWLGVKIDMSTALVASVATGLSVDDTFHCLLRWKREIRSGQSPGAALRVSYAAAGPGVILSSAAVSVGFLALTFSDFVPTANFGWLVAIATLGGSVGNLVVLPALLALRKGIGDREQGTGDRGQGTGDREQGTGDREQGTGNRGQGTGDRGQGTGDRGQGTGDRKI
jgi:predicted RND superfamily exporter protein